MSSRTALFGKPQQAQAKHLLQFKAGKMIIGDDNWVCADPRKGWVYVYQAGDGKLHFCWIDRKTGLVEDNFVIDAKQAEFKAVSQCVTGRVYLLQFKCSKRFFLWMQEPNVEVDTDICSRVNGYIKSPPPRPTSSNDWLSRLEGLNQLAQSDLLTLLSMGVGLGSGMPSESEVLSTKDFRRNQSIENSVNASSVAKFGTPSLVSTSGGTATRPTPNTKQLENAKIQLKDLRNIFSSINAGGVDALGGSGRTRIELGDVLNVENLLNLLEKEDIQTRLLPHLPSDDSEVTSTSGLNKLVVNIQSPQFKSFLKCFSAAFHTGHLAPALAQFNLGMKADEAARNRDLIAFLHAVEETKDSASKSKHDDKQVPNKNDNKTDNSKESSSSSSTESNSNNQSDKNFHSKMDTDD